MTTERLAHWFQAKITLKNKDDASTTTFYATTRHEIDNTSSTYGPAILDDIEGLGYRMADVLPAVTTGSVVLDNSPGSLGWERRFSDLLSRYTTVDQEIVINYAEAPLDSFNQSANWRQVFKGVMKGATYRPASGQISIAFKSLSIINHQINHIIDAENFPEAPDGTLGQYLPVVFGEGVEVKAVPVTAPGDTVPTYLVANYQFEFGGINKYFVKSHTGRYEEVRSAAAVSQSVWIDDPLLSGSSGATYFDGYDIAGAYWLAADTTLNNYVVTQISIGALGKGNIAYASTGTIKVEIWEGVGNTSTNPPAKRLGGGSVAIQAYQTDWRASSSFWISLALDEPIAITSNNGYWLVLRVDMESPAAPAANQQVQFEKSMTTAAAAYYFYTSGGSNNEFIRSSSTWTNYPRFEFFGCKFTESDYGFLDDLSSARAFTVEQKTALSGYTNPDISKLDFVVEVDGEKDDSSGTVTDTADALIARPDYVARLISQHYNPNSATKYSGEIDNTRFSTEIASLFTNTAGRYYRQAGGSTSGRVLALNLLADVCSELGCRVTTFNSSNSGKYWAIYPWGYHAPTAAVITDEDAEITSIEMRGSESVVNTVNVLYDKTFKQEAPIFLADGKFNGYKKSLSYTVDLNSEAEELSGGSLDVFDRKFSRTDQLNFINTEEGALFFAKWKAAVYQYPHWWVELRVPFNKYYSLNLLDVVEILHPDLPAYFGSSSNAKLPYFNGTAVEITEGEYLKRAERYRAQVEGAELEYQRGSPPMLRLTARLLTNYPADPT